MKNTPDVSNDDDSINTTVTDHAAELEKDMDNALEELKSDSENNGNDFNRTDLTQMIKDIVHEELASTKQMLDIWEKNLHEKSSTTVWLISQEKLFWVVL